MRRKSHGTYVKAAEAEQEAELEKGTKKAKTFGEMMKQRFEFFLTQIKKHSKSCQETLMSMMMSMQKFFSEK